MKVTFIIKNIGFLEYFSIPLLSAIIKQGGVSVQLINFSEKFSNNLERIKQFSPDIIGYSVASAESKDYLEINNRLKRHFSFFSVFGGPHATFFPQLIEEQGVDAVCIGEADLAFPKFLDAYKSREYFGVENFIFKNQKNFPVLLDLVENLDTLPFPDRKLIYDQSYFLRENPIKQFFAGRGCPFGCSYCFNKKYNQLYHGKGKIVRNKSVAYLIDEINAVRNYYPLNFIKFHDDCFGLNKDWLETFAEKYPREIGLPFLNYARPNVITDDYCRALKNAGCHSVCLALECGDENIRNDILHRQLSDKMLYAACDFLHKHKIKIYSLNMVGLPGENEKEMLHTVSMNQKIGVDFADASIFQPYYGTEIMEYCVKKKLISVNKIFFTSQYNDSMLDIDRQMKKKIFILHRLFSVIVDYPVMLLMYKLLTHKLIRFPLFFLTVFSRLYYSLFLHKRIYLNKIPFLLRIYASIHVVFSKNRN